MKPILLLFAALLSATSLSAQTSRETFAADKTLSASNYVAYRGPQKALTAPPSGYSPFYLSHYGRHGSRYLIGASNYDWPYQQLAKADSLGELTARGKQLLLQVGALREEARGRDGELTPLGARQHRAIARRMVERFPEVFDGPVAVDAKSTVVIRCILSMENALQELTAMRPQLRITHDASYHDMWYMNLTDRHLDSTKMTAPAREAFETFVKKHSDDAYTMSRVFLHESYWKQQVAHQRLTDRIFELASNLQSTELGPTMDLYDLFSQQDLYENWIKSNAWWYINFGPSPLNGGKQPYSQRNLLRRMIEQADSCVALERPGATLRYGHDTMVMPLAALMELGDYGQQIADLEQLDARGWRNYNIFPMACNVQMVFYRKAMSSDILVKVLLNEDEMMLPVESDCAPYYHWSDVRRYYLDKLNAYSE